MSNFFNDKATVWLALLLILIGISSSLERSPHSNSLFPDNLVTESDTAFAKSWSSPLTSSLIASPTAPAAVLPYSAIVGLPPAPATPEFDQWLEDLIAYRVNDVGPARKKTGTFYFAANGNDANLGSPFAPKRSLAEAQRLIDQASPNSTLNLRFRRGDTWFTDIGLYVNKEFVTIDSYGSALAKPIFNRFVLNYAGDWEEVPELPGVYRRLEPTIMGWLYDESIGWETPFFRASSPNNLLLMPEECSGAFHYNIDTSELYVYLAGADPNLTNLRGLPANDDIGCRLHRHGGRLKDIVFLGFGLNPQDTSNQAAGIKVTAYGDAACVVSDCESYYCSSHACHFNAGGVGLESGIATFIRCSAGFCQNNGTPGETIFNSYVYSGDQETIFSQCEARFGTLPDDTWFLPGQREVRGMSCFGHTAIGKSRLYICDRMNIGGGPFGCARGTRFADTPTATQLADVRSFVTNEQFDQFRPGAQIDIGGVNMVRVNCFYRGVLGNHGFRAWSNTANSNSWVLNSYFDLDARLIGPGYVSLYNTTSLHQMNVEHCDFIFRVLPSHRVRIPDYRSLNSVSTDWHNCVFGVVGGPRSIDVGFGLPNLENNGYFGTDRKFGGDIQPFEILNALEIQANFIPEIGDVTYGSGSNSWFQVTRDRLGTPRNSPPSLGDQEHQMDDGK